MVYEYASRVVTPAAYLRAIKQVLQLGMFEIVSNIVT